MAMPKLTPEFREFFKLLNSEQIEYLLIGGYAVGSYGYIRYTKDIDIWVSIHPDNLDRLINVLVKFGFSREGLPRPLFVPGKSQLRLGRPPDQLEVVSKISGVDFEDCYTRRKPMDFDGLIVTVISVADLKINKLSSGRTRDKADVEELDKRHKQ